MLTCKAWREIGILTFDFRCLQNFPLKHACIQGNIQEFLFLTSLSNIDVTINNQEPLRLACLNGSYKVIKLKHNINAIRKHFHLFAYFVIFKKIHFKKTKRLLKFCFVTQLLILPFFPTKHFASQ
jgi:hypothetical protein